MFRVFKISLISLCIYGVNSKAWANEDKNINPLELFHPKGGIFEIQEQQSLESEDPSIQVEIFVINQDEPYDNPLAIQAYIQFDHDSFMKLNRRIRNEDEKTYCAVGKAQLLNGSEIKQPTGLYLVIPVSRFNEESVQCPDFYEHNEVYPLQ